MASAASYPRRVEIYATLKSAADDPLGPVMSTGPLGSGGFAVSQFTIRSPVASWFPDSPQCEPVSQADCVGGEPIGVLPATLFGKMGAVVGGGGIRSLTACCH